MQIGLNYSDKTNLVSIDTERGPLKLGYDFQREVRRQTNPMRRAIAYCSLLACTACCKRPLSPTAAAAQLQCPVV